MARRVAGADVAAVATGKTRAEVAALRHLREAYYALFTSGEDSPVKQRQTSSRGRVLDTVRSLQQSGSAPPPRCHGVFGQWLTLEMLALAVDSDVSALQRELEICDARTITMQRLPLDGLDTVDPKLAVLSEVLGREALADYVAELFHEVATLRRRCALYGDALRQFRDHVKLRCIGSHRIRELLSLHEWLEIANEALLGLRRPAEPVMVSHFPVFMQHCSPPGKAQPNTVVVTELLQLLARLPPARERLVALCFEQIGDMHRGSGVAPPPEGIRPHKLAALAKQSYADALCSREELECILSWLHEEDCSNDSGGGSATVPIAAFLGFHTVVSDAFVDEDAEFVSYLMRVWRFELPQALGIGGVVADYEARCQQLTNKSRKGEVLKKLHHLQAVFPAKLASLRVLVGQLEALAISTAAEFDRLQAQQQVANSTLVGLRVLRLSGLNLREFPAFVVALPMLEELNLSDNQLRDSLTLVAIAGMKTLKTLKLSDNFLTDRNFLPLSDADASSWRALEKLTTLELSRNQLTAIPTVALQLQGLRCLYLASNKLRASGVSNEAAAQWATQGFPQLHTFDVRENGLTGLPDALFLTARQSLELLFAQDNHLVALPAALASLERLHEAVFSRNRLKSIDITVPAVQCSGLTQLALDDNPLQNFPLQNPVRPARILALKSIQLAKNRLRVLPALSNLCLDACEELDLRGNQLREISDEFFVAFPLLKICLLQQNQLARLPDSISSCARLCTLEVFENNLESVPAGLASLHELTTLNLRENQLATIPTEWHAFAFQRPRVLHTLYLQRNPLRNKVLQTLVDGATAGAVGGGGGGGSTPSVAFKSSGTQICELYVRKLIDTLKQAVAVQALAKAVHVEAQDSGDEDADADSDDQSTTTTTRRRRWKGKARFVLQHMERQLKDKRGQKHHSHAQQMLVSPKVFQQLLLKWLAVSTKKEVRLVTDRYISSGNLVDGQAFLRGVEAVGLFNALPDGDGRVDTSRGLESVCKPVDAVASILRYLKVTHELKTKPVARMECPPPPQLKTARDGASAPATTARRPQSAKTGQSPTVFTSTPTAPLRAAKNHGKPTEAAVQPWGDAAHERERERQQQRIRILEQQLLDQQMLRLAEHARRSTEDVPPSPRQGERGSKASVLVQINLLNRDMRIQRDAERLVVAVTPQATVAELKQAIASRSGVEVARQILIARHPTSARGDHVRLSNDETISSYGASAKRWAVSLLVSDLVRADWRPAAKQYSLS